MLSFQQKRLLRRVVASRMMQVMLILILVLAGYSAYGRYSIAMEMANRQETVAHELAELEERRASLVEEVSYITSERGIEAEMRRQFDVAREGEQVVIIIDEAVEIAE